MGNSSKKSCSFYSAFRRASQIPAGARLKATATAPDRILFARVSLTLRPQRGEHILDVIFGFCDHHHQRPRPQLRQRLRYGFL
jgi:hypothetical protein